MIAEPTPRGIQDWRVAEENAAAWMRYWGFTDARVTGPGSDGGVDVRSIRALAQVKWQGNAVGRPAVQNLVGARGPQHGLALLFFSNAGYTATAVTEADRSGVALFTYNVANGEVATVNTAAARLLSGTVAPSSGATAWAPHVESRKVRGIAVPLFWGAACTVSAAGAATNEDAETSALAAVAALICWVLVLVRAVRRR